MSFGSGNFCSRTWMMSLLSICTAPSCTSTGTSPRGLMPRNQGRKFSLPGRSIGCDSQGMPLRLRKIRSFCEHDEPAKCSTCTPFQPSTSRVLMSLSTSLTMTPPVAFGAHHNAAQQTARASHAQEQPLARGTERLRLANVDHEHHALLAGLKMLHRP